MVERVEKAPDNEEKLSYVDQEMWLKSFKGWDELLKLCKTTSFLPFDSSEDTYKIWDDKILLKKEIINNPVSGAIQEAKFTIVKFIKGNIIKGQLPRVTTYELTANCNDGAQNVVYRLYTDDGRGQEDEKFFTKYLDEVFLQNIVTNFEKRYKELEDYRASEREKKEKRMQELADNDQDEADDALWKLDNSYNA